MKCQILFTGKNKKNVTNLSSAENFTQRHAIPILMKGYVKETQEYLVCCKLNFYESKLNLKQITLKIKLEF